MAIHGDLAKYNEIQGSEYHFTLQNSKLLKVDLRHGPFATGEGVDLMHVGGTGEVFIADTAQDVIVLYLENDQVSVNGKNILAFSSTIQWDIQRIGGGVAGMVAGGLYNVVLQGTGFIAINTDGQPVVLDVGSAPTAADPQAAIMWSGGVQMQMKKDTTGGLKSLARGGSGETFQMAFGGQGFVMVQPSEGPVFGAAAGSGGGGVLGALGG